MITGSNSLLNQYTPTFSIKNIVSGQSLVYDPNKKAFVNAFISGTGGATSLDSLTDVNLNIPGLQVGQALTYAGPNNWTNTFITYSSITGKPVLSPVATAGTLVSLTDVNTTSLLNGDTLIWNTGTSKWVSSPGGSGSTTLAGLTDVDVATRANNQLLYYDAPSLTWKNINLPILSKAVQSITALSDVNTGIVGNGYLRWNAGGTAVTFVTTIAATSITGLATVATTGSYASLTGAPTIPTLTSQLTNNSGYLTAAGAVTRIIAGTNVTITPISGISDVTINSTSTVTSNIEKVIFQYTAGSSGNFVGVTPIVSSGVSVNIIDATNCLASYTFTGYTTPPVAVMTYGQNFSSNTFAVRTNGQLPVNNSTVAGGGTVGTPDLLNGIIGASTPFTMQTRMSDTGASAGFGQRAYLMILFKF